MKSFLDVMNLWPSPDELASDLGAKLSRIQKWRVRKKIPPEAWPGVLEAAKRRGFSVSAETLLSATTGAAQSLDVEDRLGA